MTLGFIGTGRIASALVRGLCGSQAAPKKVLVSPRGPENAVALDEIRAAGGIEAILAALDAVLARLGEAVPERLERD